MVCSVYVYLPPDFNETLYCTVGLAPYDSFNVYIALKSDSIKALMVNITL
jgi:hypothetical protein